MPLSNGAISELTLERDALIRTKADIDARLDAITLLVGRTKRGASPARPKTRKNKASIVAKGVTPAVSLRGAIKQTLSGITVDMFPGEIIKKLKTPSSVCTSRGYSIFL